MGRNFRNNNQRSRNRGRNRGGSNNRQNNRGGRNNRTKIDPNKYISANQPLVDQEREVYNGIQFQNFNLSPKLLENLHQKGFKTTTAIQQEAIPAIQAGNDIVGISATGSGKTGAFLIPLIDKALKNDSENILVITPTRELALQILKEGISLIKGSKLRIELVIGGESIYKQKQNLQKNPAIVVGTPGRLLDMVDRKHLNLNRFNNLVIDEVDRMLDMGFIGDIKKLFAMTASSRQSLFFSATMDNRIEGIIKDMVGQYKMIKLSENKPINMVKQDVIYFDRREEKIDKLHSILMQEEVTKTVVFVETRRYADKVGKKLQQAGIRTGVIHGNKNQNQRKRIMEEYRRTKFNVLVATNVAARGLDIDDISHVINFDEPESYDEYIHRIGRTGRNGKEGTAYTFVGR